MKTSYLVKAVLAALAEYAALAVVARITPIELLQRPMIKSAPMIKTNSDAGQFAGRTTLSSGSATVTVSTRIVNSDSILHMTPQAALEAGYTTQGRTGIASGLSIGTASTPAVYSGDVIHATWESPNALNSGQALRVDSIVGGVSFAIATANSLTTIASGAVAMWKIMGKDPVGLKINTISPLGHFIIGWADGIARPFDTTVMWDIKRST